MVAAPPKPAHASVPGEPARRPRRGAKLRFPSEIHPAARDHLAAPYNRLPVNAWGCATPRGEHGDRNVSGLQTRGFDALAGQDGGQSRLIPALDALDGHRPNSSGSEGLSCRNLVAVIDEEEPAATRNEE